jgi:hypothetical protein
MTSLDLIEAILTGVLSFLSVMGSMLVLLSYIIAARVGTPKIASRLIRNLAVSDLVWFLATAIISTIWIFGAADGYPGAVPDEVCYITSPLVGFGRMSSLFWTCCISIDLLQSISRRSKNRKVSISSAVKREETPITTTASAEMYYFFYYLFVVLLSLPGPVLTVIIQHTTNSSNLGCDAGYEEMGDWFIVTAVEVLPIFFGISIIICVFIQIRAKMASRFYPQSVRLNTNICSLKN